MCGAGTVGIRQYNQLQWISQSDSSPSVSQTAVRLSARQQYISQSVAVHQSVGGSNRVAGTAHSSSGSVSTRTAAQCSVSARGVMARHGGMVCGGSVWYVNFSCDDVACGVMVWYGVV